MQRTWINSAIIAMAALLVIGGLTPAQALDVKVSGQINQMGMWADDGQVDNFFITDNNNSSTRARITGEEKTGAVKIGFQFEMEALRNASNTLTMDREDDGTFSWNDRWLNAYIDTKFGKFELGKGDSAANATTEVDLSGTSVINYSDINATAGAFVWKNSDGSIFRPSLVSGVLVGEDVDNTRSNFDGTLSRTERFRYNTPTFAGFTLSGSVANGDAYDASLWYAAEVYGKLAAAIGYTDTAKRNNHTQLAGSVSWLLPMGLNFTGAYGMRNLESDEVAPGKEDPTSYYFKVGYKTGIHAASVEYGMTEDLDTNGDKSSHYGVAYVINPWKPVELYASYRIYSLDVDTIDDPEDIQQVMAGTRIKF